MDNMDFEKLATKEDLKQFATKEDLKVCATKDDLKEGLANYATKDDLKEGLANYATKDDLKEEINRLEDAIFSLDVKVDKKINALDEKIDERFDEVINHIDGAMKVFKDTEEETAAHTVSYREHTGILDNHEKRIGVLELKPLAV